MFTSARSLTKTAIRRPPEWRSRWLTRVLLPAPRNPESTVTGSAGIKGAFRNPKLYQTLPRSWRSLKPEMRSSLGGLARQARSAGLLGRLARQARWAGSLATLPAIPGRRRRSERRSGADLRYSRATATVPGPQPSWCLLETDRNLGSSRCCARVATRWPHRGHGA
jgi:hypothetical protein